MTAITGKLAGGLGRLGDFGLVAPLLAVAMGWLLPPVGELGHTLPVPSVIMMFAMSVAMVALPSLLGLALRQALRGAHRTLAFRPMRGLGTLGVCDVGLALAHGLSAKLDADIPWAACLVGLALTSLVGGTLGLTTGVISGRLGGERLGATFALGGAVRNVSLLWSATVGISPRRAKPS
ncbi:MAG: hypothetical protein JWO26_1223 [Rhodospirillales bacterium]|jgi:ribose/xylose/arabinose/galactoside ABC-type transport system permease subunit|nr:hypothetical protein [Rhodospirillales bacterium]